MEFVILTGMSGAGKSVAANTLEDMGYLCIDNMPAAFIPAFAELSTKQSPKNDKVAFVIDVRGEIEFETLITELDVLKKMGYACFTVFVDCDDKILINRYKENRRIHPLVPIKNISMTDAISLERNMLAPIKNYADFVIDTSKLSVRQLRDKIFALRSKGENDEIILTFTSFGFKNGIVSDADIVLDVRCFPNPFYVADLKDKSGLEKEVSDYVFSNGDVDKFVEMTRGLLDFLIPRYIEEGKTQLTVAFGCTGGKHRSVAIAERLRLLYTDKYKTFVSHRDIEKLYQK